MPARTGERADKRLSQAPKLCSLEQALKACGLRDGDTLSFHHQLREGDLVVNSVLAEAAVIGAKDLRLAPTALFSVHAPLIQHIEAGVVNRIEGSVNGTLGGYLSAHPLPHPLILRSHGRRWAAVKSRELPVDIAVIAASAADELGNATGLLGKSAFGPLAYSAVDASHAGKVIVVTDNLLDRPCPVREIDGEDVDCVVVVDRIGSPEGIVSGSLRIPEDAVAQDIARRCVELLEAAGLVRSGMVFQAGAGGTSLAAVEHLHRRMKQKGICAAMATGGLTRFLVNMHAEGTVDKLCCSQAFDLESVEFMAEHPGMYADIGRYADPTADERLIDQLDTVILGATEVDVGFNVNANTHSDGRLMHGIGGHQDTARAASLTIVAVPLTRKRHPIVREKVTTVTTPGFVVDAVVTQIGVAVNPVRRDLLEALEGKVPLLSIEDMKAEAYRITGDPEPPELLNETVGLVTWIDGTLLDIIWRVKEQNGSERGKDR